MTNEIHLALEIARNNKRIHVYQRKYTLGILVEYGFLESKPCITPTSMHKKDYNSSKLIEDNKHRKLIAKLLYLTNTRPDIAFAVQQLSQHLETPQ